MRERLLLYGAYLVIIALCTWLAEAVFAQPPPGVTQDFVSSGLAGIGVGIAGCLLLRNAMARYRARDEIRGR